MNYDAMIRKHLKGLDEVLAAVDGKPETKERIRATVKSWVNEKFPSIVHSGITTVSSSGTTTVYPADYVPSSVPFFSTQPIVPEEPFIEGDTPGATGTFYTETLITESPPEMIGGWPDKSLVRVLGLAANRRHIRGTLGDGRMVAVERKEPWTAGSEVRAKLVRAGASPLYRMVG